MRIFTRMIASMSIINNVVINATNIVAKQLNLL